MFDLCRGQHEITACVLMCMCACVQREREREMERERGWGMDREQEVKMKKSEMQRKPERESERERNCVGRSNQIWLTKSNPKFNSATCIWFGKEIPPESIETAQSKNSSK